MTVQFDAAIAVLVIPAVAAALLVLLPPYRLTARLNVLAALLTFLSALSLFFGRPELGRYLLVDDLNNQGHALGAGRRQHQAILQRHETDHLADRVAPRHHDQQTEQHH